MLLKDIEQLLHSQDDETRRSALKMLSGISLQESLPILITAMGDESWRVRKEAVDVFVSQHPDEICINKLLELFRNEDNAGLRNSAAEAVIRLGSASVGSLVIMIGDPDRDVRKFIIDVMGAIGDHAFISPLLGALSDEDVNVASAAAEHLGSLGDLSAVPYLISSIISNESVLFRFSALEALGKLSPVGAVPPEILKLADQEILRKAVYEFIGKSSDLSSCSFLVDGLSSQHKSARTAALKSLYNVFCRSSDIDREQLSLKLNCLKDTDTIKLLLDLFDGSDDVLINSLIWFSTITLDEKFVPLLIQAFVVERFSKPSLAALKCFGKEGISDLVSRFADLDDNARSALCVLIGECGYVSHDDMIVKALSDNSSKVRKAAAHTVGKLDLVGSISVLALMIDDVCQEVASAAVSSLQKLAALDRDSVLEIARRFGDSEFAFHRRHAPALLSSTGEYERLYLLINDEDPLVRKAAISSISQLGTGADVHVLKIALLDDDPDVRLASVEALGSTRDSTVIANLLTALADSDVWVQCAAIKAINLVSPEHAFEYIKNYHGKLDGLLMITCLQILETFRTQDAIAIIRSAKENHDPDIIRQATKSLELCLNNNN